MPDEPTYPSARETGGDTTTGRPSVVDRARLQEELDGTGPVAGAEEGQPPHLRDGDRVFEPYG